MTKKKIIITISIVAVALITAGSLLAISRGGGFAEEQETEVKQSIKTKSETLKYDTDAPDVSGNSSKEKTTEEEVAASESEPVIKNITVDNLKAVSVSVSCIKVTWDAEDKREYQVQVNTEALYPENITVVPKEKGMCYITGLRENSEYNIIVEPVLMNGENESDCNPCLATVVAKTEQADIVQEYEVVDGNTACFAGEKASGLNASPSLEAITDTIVDPITATGIRRNAYGDYCCAMGIWYGAVGDRFLVELENGIQFTVAICDSKGEADDMDGDGMPDGLFHWFGGEGNGKCVIEFIYDDENLPADVGITGNWGEKNWNGLNLSSNIQSLKKIGFGKQINY